MCLCVPKKENVFEKRTPQYKRLFLKISNVQTIEYQ
jgi:hypothetical protein